jgi:hypothetical protein
MTDAAAVPVKPMSLVSRFIGIITAPKATYENVVAAPRPFGILFVCALLIGIGGTLPQLTEQARTKSLEAQVSGMERFGMNVTPEMRQQFEVQSHNKTIKIVTGVVGPLIMIPIFALLLTAIFWAAFNAMLGGTATFKQVLSVTSHSYVITAVGVVASAPILYINFQMVPGGPFNLGALAPMLDESSAIKNFLSAVSIFSLWAWANVGIGLSVLYRRNPRNVAIAMIVVALLFALAFSSLFSAFRGN